MDHQLPPLLTCDSEWNTSGFKALVARDEFSGRVYCSWSCRGRAGDKSDVDVLVVMKDHNRSGQPIDLHEGMFYRNPMVS
jgi:hypothetical protein